MKSVSNIKDCYGCGVCSASCYKNAISIKLNNNGFYEPLVDKDLCVNCGICTEVCAFSHKTIALKSEFIKSWAAWSNDSEIRQKCSSGGIGYEIGRQLIENGYKVVGCRYDINKQRAEHYIAFTIEDLIQSIGSKYIQSYTEECFKQIDFKTEKYLVTGTPCQIDSFRRMIRKFHCENNFILMDFFCHSVPSMLAWKSYIRMLEPLIGKVTYASWRNKFDYGWHDSWIMGIDGEKTSEPVNWQDCYKVLIQEKKSSIQSRWSQGDMFYKLFLGDMCSGIHCEHNCKYKHKQSSADIRIGDFWGCSYKDDEKGVSALVAFTSKGEDIVNGLNNVTLINHQFNEVVEGQMKGNAKPAQFKPVIMFLLRRGVRMDSLLFKSVYNAQRCLNVIKTRIKRYL